MNELLTIYRCTCFHKFLKQSEQVFFVGVFFFFVEQTRLVLNDSKYFGIGNFCNCALSTSSSFLVFAIEYSWQSTLFEIWMFFFHHSLSLFTWQKRGSWIGPQLSTTMALLLSTIGKKVFGKHEQIIDSESSGGYHPHHSLCGSSLVNVIWLRTPTDGREQEKSMIFQSSPGTRLGWNGL